ncbi:MAG TPA: hypothetical protein VK483_16170, partial [Chitinophagaceae bacterium]|nr:hypothetical protein [Chitinophagaceae bacterium]
MKTFLCKYRVFAMALLIAGLLSLSLSEANAADRYSVANSNWNTTATWSATSGGAAGASVPVAGDNVFIEGGFTVSITANAACATLTVGTATAGTLQFNNTTTRTLTVTGNINVNNGTFTTADAGGANIHSLLIGGNLSVTTGNTLQFVNGNDVVNVTFNGVSSSFGGTGTISFNGLDFSNGSAGTVSITSNIGVAGTMSVGANCTLDPSAGVQINSAAPAGTISGTGTIKITRIAATADYSTQYRFSTNSLGSLTLDYAGAGDQTINGGFGSGYGNLKTSGSGIKTMGAAQTINNACTVGSGTTLDESTRTMTINAAAGSLVVNGTLDFTASAGLIQTGATAGTVTLTMGSTGIIRTVDPLGIGPVASASLVTGTAAWDVTSISTSGTVEYYAGVAQALTDRDYNNLTISTTAGTKTWTIGGTRTINGSLIINATAPLTFSGAQTVNVNGDWVNSGTFTAGTGTVNFATAATHILAGLSTTTFNNLTITTGTLDAATNNKDLAVAANWTNNGTFAPGTATVTFTSASAQTIGGSSTTTFNNIAMIGVGNKTFEANTNLTNTMTFTAGPATIDFNGAANNKVFTLKSNALNTARIANVNGFILNGEVIVERFIPLRPGLGRAYRFLTSTVNTSTNMRTNWMEGGQVTVAGGFSDPVPGYGTHITGSANLADNFDITQTNQSSIYTATNGGTSATLVYTPVPNASGTLSGLQGYFVFVRGNRSESLSLPTTPGMSTSATTLRATGTLLTGTQTSFGTMVGGAGSLNGVTNPYESPIDWSLVQPSCSNIGTSYTLWDPRKGTRGGFVTVNTLGIPSETSAANQFIQPGQAFFVEASGASAPVISIQEAHKAAGNNNDVFRPGALYESFRIDMYFTEQPSGFRRIADGVVALYDNAYSAGIDINDASEINNWDENIAIARAGKHLAIESRPVILTKDTLPLFMNNMRQMAYEFEFTPSSFTNTGLKAELIDNFLGTRTVLSVTAATVVAFTVTSDPASSASDRFMVVFGTQAPLAVDLITIRANKVNNGVQVDWTSRTERDMDHYEVERSANGGNFSRLNTTAAIGNSSGPVNYSWLDANP